MTVRLQEPVIHLEGECRVEEAERLTALLEEKADRTVDLSACTGLHAALLQTLLAHAAPAHGTPVDAFLAQWIAPMVAVRHSK